MYNWLQQFDDAAKSGKSIYRHAFRRGDLSYRQIFKILQKYLDFKPYDHVVDIGGSTGSIARLIAKKTQHVTLIDYSPQQLLLAEKYNKRFAASNINQIYDSLPKLIQIEDSHYNKVIMGSVIQYLNPHNRRELHSTFKNLYRIMAPDAKACLYHHYGEKSKILYQDPQPDWYDSIFWISYDEVKAICKDVGFRSCEKIDFCSSAVLRKRLGSLDTVENPNIGLNILLQK
mgnify:CR=1 FL=1|tara:strand:- start:651 stop:1340 length:690 start_codon:yes stop_codon:yes gene_type:complete